MKSMSKICVIALLIAGSLVAIFALRNRNDDAPAPINQSDTSGDAVDTTEEAAGQTAWTRNPKGRVKEDGVPPGEVLFTLEDPEAFYFIQGHYVEPPYVVRMSLPERTLYLNRGTFKELPFAPERYKSELPRLPASITAKSSWQELDRFKFPDQQSHQYWALAHLDHFQSIYSPEESVGKFIEAIQKFPFYERHEWLPGNADLQYLRVHSKAGDSRDYFSGWWIPENYANGDFFSETIVPAKDYRPYSLQGDFVELTLKKFANSFKHNSVESGRVSVNGGSGSMWIKRDSPLWYQVVNMVRILNSELPAEKKTMGIYQRVLPESHVAARKFLQRDRDWKAIAEIVTNYRPNAHLTARIQALEKTLPVPLWNQSEAE